MVSLVQAIRQKIGLTGSIRLLPLALIVFFVLRLLFILRFPIFNDEALTIRYGKIAVETPYHFYTVIVGGKQPLLYWADGIATHLLPDPLFAGRLISLLFGFGTILGVYFLTTEVSSPRTAGLAALFYAVAPVHILFDGMAIHDAAVTCLFVWIIFFLERIAKKYSLVFVSAVGILIAVGLWIKTTAMLFLFVSAGVLAYLFLRKKITLGQSIMTLAVWAAIITVLLLPLVLRPEFEGIIRMQGQYALTVSDIVKLPLETWYYTLRDITLVNVGYVTPLVYLSLGYAAWQNNTRTRLGLVLVSYALTFFFLVITAKSMHSRYMVFSVALLIPVLAQFGNRFRTLGLVGLVVMFAGSLILVTNPPGFFHLFPKKWVYNFEAFQYIDGWPSGYGVGEALAFVDRDRGAGPAFIGVRWDAGNPEDTVLLYAPKLPNTASGFFDKKLENFPLIVEKIKNFPIYFITRNDQRGGLDDHLTLLAKFYKPSHVESIEVYRYLPDGKEY